MPKFAKGSQEAKDWAKKMVEARAVKAGRKPVGENEEVSIKKMGTPQLVLPEYFATRTKKGWKLVNPLTQERNLSTRWGETSVRLSRKPIADAVYLDGDTETIHLSLFSPKDRETIRNTFLKGIADNSSKSLDKKPSLGLGEIKERGRPEKLPKNIEINKERKAEAKKANAKPKGRPSKYGDDEEARKQAKKEQDRIANQKRTEKRKAEKAKGKGVGDSGSDDAEIVGYLEQAKDDARAEEVARARRIAEQQQPPMRRPVARKMGEKTPKAPKASKSAGGAPPPIQSSAFPMLMFQPSKGAKRKAESSPSEGTGMYGTDTPQARAPPRRPAPRGPLIPTNRILQPSQWNFIYDLVFSNRPTSRQDMEQFLSLASMFPDNDFNLIRNEFVDYVRRTYPERTPEVANRMFNNMIRNRIENYGIAPNSSPEDSGGEEVVEDSGPSFWDFVNLMDFETDPMEGTGSYRGFKRLDQENIVLTMDESGDFPMLIKKETIKDLRMLHKELKTQLREAKIGKQSHSTIAEHNDLREKIKQLEDEMKSRTMSGAGKNPKQLKRDIARAREMAMDLGSIVEESPPGPAPFVPALDEPIYIAYHTTDQLRATLDEALEQENYIFANELITAIEDRERRESMAKSQLGPMKPKGFLQGGKRVYGEGTGLFSDSLTGKMENKISTTNIEKMPKKSKMTTDSGMGLYAGMASPASGRGMYAGEGFFGDLAKSAGKVLAPIAIDAGSKYLKGKLAGSGMCCGMCGSGMYAGAPTPALPPSGMGMYAGDGLYAGMASPASGRGMDGCGMCGSTMSGCGMCGGLIYNPSNDPEIEKMNQHIRQVMGHHLQLGMSGKGIFGDIGRWFKKAGRTINRSVIQPVGKAFSKGGPLEQVGKTIGGFVIRKGLPALANLATDVIGQPELGALATPLASKGADALATSLGVGMGGKPKKSSAWIDLVKRVQKEKGVSYKEAMTIASGMRR